MDKRQIKEFFAPHELDLFNIHHLYIEIDHQSKQAFYELHQIKTDYITRDYINFLYKGVDIFDKEKWDNTLNKIRDISKSSSDYVEYLIENNILPYNFPQTLEDNYQEVLNFLNRNNLITKMPKWDDSYYIGKRYDEYYILVSHSRDSKILEESNYQSIKSFCEKNSINFIEIRSNHWAVGWIESIGVREDDYDSIEKCEEILEKLEEYPIFDEEDFSQRESEEASRIEEMIKEDLKKSFSQNSLTYNEKVEYAKRMWQIDLNRSIKDQLMDMVEI